VQSLTPDQTYGNINSPTVFTASGPLTVISVNNIQNAPLTFSGSANSRFVVLVSGSYQTNVQNVLTGGVTASDILFDFTGTSGNAFQTSGGDLLQGTFLATMGGSFQFSELNLTGQLINTDGHIQDVSGSYIPTADPFTPPAVPEPGSLRLFGLGVFASCVLAWRSRRKRQPKSLCSVEQAS
jgi:hypothetical protein